MRISFVFLWQIKSIGSRAAIVPMDPRLALFFARLIGRLTGDVVLTRDEVEGLSAGLLVSSSAPTCHTKFTDWAAENRATLGVRYASEIERHYK